MVKHSICRLTPELLDDYLSFFDHDAFRDNPDWQSCYCACYHCYSPAGDLEWEERSGEQNRALVRELILTGRMHGYLAYADGRVAGWCHAALWVDLPLPHGIFDLPQKDGGGVGSIVCFVVAKGHRRQGISRQLGDAAYQGLQAMGAHVRASLPTNRAGDRRRELPRVVGHVPGRRIPAVLDARRLGSRPQGAEDAGEVGPRSPVEIGRGEAEPRT